VHLVPSQIAKIHDSQWLSANMVVSSFAIGLLAKSLFFLGFVDAILVCLFFNFIGVLSVCFFSTFGPRFGLRQMVLSRFWFGWYGVKLSASHNSYFGESTMLT
jgi:purine-cytosine permease-like protein